MARKETAPRNAAQIPAGQDRTHDEDQEEDSGQAKAPSFLTAQELQSRGPMKADDFVDAATDEDEEEDEEAVKPAPRKGKSAPQNPRTRGPSR